MRPPVVGRGRPLKQIQVGGFGSRSNQRDLLRTASSSRLRELPASSCKGKSRDKRMMVLLILAAEGVGG
jgi:hypothetical protein